MRWILLQLAKLARLRRRFLGKTTPHWFTDATGLFGYVNIFSVGLAIFAMASAPDHFFGRLPQYTQRKKSWLLSPLKFFTSSLTLMAAILAASNNLDPPDTIHMSPETTRWVVGGSFLLAPVLMPVLCAFLIPIDLLVALVTSGKPIMDSMLIPLSVSTYARLDAARYLWSMLYFGVYNFVIWQFLIIVAFLTWVTFWWLLTYDRSYETLLGVIVSLPLLTVVWVPFFLLSVFFLVLPYVALLTHCLRVPTSLVLRIAWDDLRRTIEACEQMAQTAQWGELEKYIPTLGSHVAFFSAMHRQTTFGKDVPPKLIAGFKDDRRKLYDAMLNTTPLRSLVAAGPLAVSVRDELNSLLDQLDLVR